MAAVRAKLVHLLIMPSFWIKAVAAIAAVWLVAGGIMWWARASKPTAASIIAQVDKYPLEGRDAAERERTIRRLANSINQLDYEERREMRVDRKLDGFFRSLTPAEQSQFLDLTLPTGFRQMMDAFNKMEPRNRKKMVDRALADLRDGRDSGRMNADDDQALDENARKIVEQGLRSFYSDASAEVKLDLAPLIEEMQQSMQFR